MLTAANMCLRQLWSLQLTRKCSKRKCTPGKFAACHGMIVQRHMFWQKKILPRAGFGPDLSSFLPLLQNLISSKSKATVCSPLAVRICMLRAHANKYLEPDAELGQLGVATCQQLLQACELGLLSSCAAWLLYTHNKHHHCHTWPQPFHADKRYSCSR